MFIDLCEKSWWRPSRPPPPKARRFGAVWVDALSTSARGKPVCGQRAPPSSSSGNTSFSLKKKKKCQGLLCLAGNVSVSPLQKQDQVLGDSEVGDGWAGG